METPAWHVLLVQIATFGIGAILLWVIAIRPIGALLGERRDRIVEAEASLAAAKSRVEDAERELRRRLDDVEDEMKRRTQAAEADARKVREDMVRRAQEDIRAEVAKGREQVRRERAAQREALRREVARLSVRMAGKVLGRTIAASDRKRLVARVLADIPSTFGKDRP